MAEASGRIGAGHHQHADRGTDGYSTDWQLHAPTSVPSVTSGP